MSRNLSGSNKQSTNSRSDGVLYIVPTPIGNLEDITIRAKKILEESDLILAEDTRKAAILKTAYGLKAPVKSLYGEKEKRMIPFVLEKLKSGLKISIISESGTPAISDPGANIVRAAIEKKLKVVVLPGPVAFVPAIILSGLEVHPFLFYGFLPAHPKRRRKTLKSLINIPYTLAFYESPHRIKETLTDCLTILGNRKASLSREISKLYEETIRGTIQEILDEISKNPRKGEMVLIIEGFKNGKEK